MANPTNAAVLLALVVVVLGFGLLAVSASYEDAEEHRAVTEEPITQDVGNWTAVDATAEPNLLSFDETVTVRDHNGTELEESADYEWNAANGSVYVNATADTTAGQDATIDYDYVRRPEQAESMLAPLRTMFEAIGVLPLVLGLGLVAGAIRLFNANVGSGTYGGRR